MILLRQQIIDWKYSKKNFIPRKKNINTQFKLDLYGH